MTAQMSPAGHGTACPRCHGIIANDAVETGDILCPHCNRPFSLVTFTPPARSLYVVRAGEEGPESAGSCANHPRNAAIGNCDRCGIVMCALCEMQLEGSHYCPLCFERVIRDGGTDLVSEFPDYAGRARIAARLSIVTFFFGIPLGFGAIYYAVKAMRNRSISGVPKSGLVWSIILGVIGMAFSTFLIFAMLTHRNRA